MQQNQMIWPIMYKYSKSSHSVENGKFQNRTLRIHHKYDSHSVVLADLLYKTKPHYSEDCTTFVNPHYAKICCIFEFPINMILHKMIRTCILGTKLIVIKLLKY